MAPSNLIFSLLLLIFFLSHNFSSASTLTRRRSVPDTPPLLRALQTRKMLREMVKELEVDGGERRRPSVEWDQLRRVPSGPDPLHHNGGSPKKPRTP
ncbi:hypothetical protein SDJN03_19623, partial [Cucurbita argyrosperma subsp. sororia]